MSGYNAEYTAPRDNEEEELNGTLAPLEEEVTLPNKLRHISISLHSENSSSPYSQELADIAFTVQQELAKLEEVKSTVEELRTALQQARTADIQAHDHRLTHIWESASEIADRRGYCDVFDSIMEELGTGYTREMEYCVTVVETIKYDIHVTAPRNADQSDIEELIGYETLSDHTEIERDWEVENYESAD